jgi:hypothetical protein
MSTDDSDLDSQLVKLVGRAIADLGSQSGRITADVTLASDLGATFASGGAIDDRKYIVSYLNKVYSHVTVADPKQYEGIIQLAASLPNDSDIRDNLGAIFIKKLWYSLEHPPMSYLGDDFRYRKADGSNNVGPYRFIPQQDLMLIKPIEYFVPPAWSCRKSLCPQRCGDSSAVIKAG